MLNSMEQNGGAIVDITLRLSGVTHNYTITIDNEYIPINTIRDIYIKSYSNYKKALENRSRILKTCQKGGYFDEYEIISWSEYMAEYAANIYLYRKEYIKKLEKYSKIIMCDISGGKEDIDFEYISDIENDTDDISLIKADTSAIKTDINTLKTDVSKIKEDIVTINKNIEAILKLLCLLNISNKFLFLTLLLDILNVFKNSCFITESISSIISNNVFSALTNLSYNPSKYSLEYPYLVKS